MPLMTMKTIARGATLVLVIAAIGAGCIGKRAKFAPPSDAPEPPPGNGWYCFHATTPHAISSCSRDMKTCTRVHKAYAVDKTEKTEGTPEKPRTEVPVHGAGAFLATPGEDDELERNDEPAQPESGEALSGICSIDPSACPMVDPIRQSIPEYSTCSAKERAYCSAFYHEYNFWRPYKENHWHYFCAESAEHCEAWRDLWHLHLVKRPCTPVP